MDGRGARRRKCSGGSNRRRRRRRKGKSPSGIGDKRSERRQKFTHVPFEFPDIASGLFLLPHVSFLLLVGRRLHQPDAEPPPPAVPTRGSSPSDMVPARRSTAAILLLLPLLAVCASSSSSSSSRGQEQDRSALLQLKDAVPSADGPRALVAQTTAPGRGSPARRSPESSPSSCPPAPRAPHPGGGSPAICLRRSGSSPS